MRHPVSSGLQLTWSKCGVRGSNARPLLSVTDLVVRVGVRRVLDGINLEVFPGDHVRITGPNGCGKSSLLNAVAGVAPAQIENGRIIFDGADITDWPAHERAGQGIAYMRQVDNVFPSLTVHENLTIALGTGGYDRFAKSFPDWARDFPADTRAGLLSGGQRKKLAWGMTALTGKKLFLADEPEAGVAERLYVPNDITSYVVITHENSVPGEMSGEER